MGDPPTKRNPSCLPSARSDDNVPRGILYMIAATVLFAITAALANGWLRPIRSAEVMFFRSFFSFLVGAAVVCR